MPTTYETGSATDVHNVLHKLAEFASSIGWTIDNPPTHVGDLRDPDSKVDDTQQSGYIDADSFPWISNVPDTYSIENGVITSEKDPGSNYYVQQLGFTPGDLLEITVEIMVHTQGSLWFRFGDNIHKLQMNSVREWKYQHVMGAGGYLSVTSSDFIGTFRLVSIRKINRKYDYLSLHKSNVGFFNLRSDHTEMREYQSGALVNPGPYIYLNSANSYNSNLAWDNQLGKSGNAVANGLAPHTISGNDKTHIHAYHFFGNEKHIYVALEIEPGEFSHFGFGNIRKYFDFRGGNFVYGTDFRFDTYQNNNDWLRTGGPFGQYNQYVGTNYMRADLQGIKKDIWLNDNINGNPVNHNRLYGTYYGHTNQQYEENNYYGVAPLVPVYFAGEDINSYRYSLGEMEGYRITFCKYIDPLTVISINGEDWMIIPIKRKQLTTPAEYISNTGNKALAYYIGPSV